MSWKSNFPDGIVLNCEHDGLLTVAEERLISIIKKEPISNVYHVEQTPFARGKFAAVRKCTHQQTGVEYAAKFIRKRRRAMDQRQDIIHEVAVLQLAADCPSIVSLHEVFETASEVALVLELASGGELQTVLDVQEGLQESEAILVMRQIIEGLGFLHDRNIAHLDLKPQNLLLTGTYPECDIKLCDFGISRVIQGGVEVREILGTPDYVAPEILSYEPISLATDIWSVGVLAYVLLSGFSPFGGDTKQETFLNISQCSLTFPSELFEGVSGAAKDFIRATLQTEPKKRLTSRQCLQHPWLNPVAPPPRSVAVEAIGVEEVGVLPPASREVFTVFNMQETAREVEILPPAPREVCAIVNVQGPACMGTVREVETLPPAPREVCAIVNVQGPACVGPARVAETVRVGTASIDRHTCRMGEDITRQYLQAMGKEGGDRGCVGDKINGLKISTVSLDCVEYKERRIVVEMCQEGGERGDSPESDEDLPLHKRPKNCEDTCGFPHCRHLPTENICHTSPTIERPLLC